MIDDKQRPIDGGGVHPASKTDRFYGCFQRLSRIKAIGPEIRTPLPATDYAHELPPRMLPSSATDQPNASKAAPSDAVSSTCSLHVPPLCTNTYAAPWVLFEPTTCCGAPTTIVLPLTAMEEPK